MLSIKFGTVHEINEKEHKIRLREIDTNIVGPLLSVLCVGSGTGRSYNLPAQGEPVCCLMLGNFLGIVLGSYWTTGKFETGSKDEYYFIRIDDNNVIKYNTNTKEYTLKTSGAIKLESTDVQLGISPTSKAMLYDAFNTWVTDPVNGLEAWIKIGVAPSGGGTVTYAGPFPSISNIEAQNVKVK